MFHDAYKGWGCCNKKVTDFTEFLNIPGCTTARHNGEKPAEPEKKKIVEQGELADATHKLTVTAKPPPTSAARDDAHAPLLPIPKTVSPALRKLHQEVTDAQTNAQNSTNAAAANTGEEQSVEIAPGTVCKNSSCGRTYGPDTNDVCWHHPGVAIFHEGMKYWSCCNKKTSDFDNFLSQPGCTCATHKWNADPHAQAAVHCRDDFHQTPTHVVLTYYLKKAHPDLTTATANTVTLHVSLVSLAGARKDLDLQLWGAIDVSASAIALTPSKVELKLKKAQPVSWPLLVYTPPPPTHSE